MLIKLQSKISQRKLQIRMYFSIEHEHQQTINNAELQ